MLGVEVVVDKEGEIKGEKEGGEVEVTSPWERERDMSWAIRRRRLRHRRRFHLWRFYHRTIFHLWRIHHKVDQEE